MGPTLFKSFFDIAGKNMSNELLLVLAEIDGNLIAGALNLLGWMPCTAGIGDAPKIILICILKFAATGN